MPWMPGIDGGAGYPKPSDFLGDLRRVYRNEEPEGGEKTARRRRMRKALEADPVTFLQVMSLHQAQYDRRVARWWAQRDKAPKRSKVALEPAVPVEAPADTGMDILEGL